MAQLLVARRVLFLAQVLRRWHTRFTILAMDPQAATNKRTASAPENVVFLSDSTR